MAQFDFDHRQVFYIRCGGQHKRKADVDLAIATLRGRLLPTTEEQIPGFQGRKWLRQQWLASGSSWWWTNRATILVACESFLNNETNSNKTQAHAFSKPCGGQTLPTRADQVVEWSTNISTNLHRGRSKMGSGLGILNGLGGWHVPADDNSPGATMNLVIAFRKWPCTSSMFLNVCLNVWAHPPHNQCPPDACRIIS